MVFFSILRCASIVITLLIPTSVMAQNDAGELAAKLGQLNTLSGQFQQTLVDAQGQVLQKSSGDFLLKRPGFFRWETYDPFPQLLVSNLETIWLYDSDLEQVTVRPYNDQVSQMPVLLFSGDAQKIHRHYTVTKIGPDDYELLPSSSHNVFNLLVVSFNNSQLEKVVLIDSLEQQTTFLFLNVEYNTNIDSSRFEFSPPVGTDVITAN
jgi:outer membrane lipoprotein carrier protein